MRYGDERSVCGLKEWQGLYRKSLMKLSYCSIQTVTHRLMALYALVTSRCTLRQLATSNWVRILVSVCTFVYMWVVCFVSVMKRLILQYWMHKDGQTRTVWSGLCYHLLLLPPPPWIRSLELFRHRRVAIVSRGVHDLLFL